MSTTRLSLAAALGSLVLLAGCSGQPAEQVPADEDRNAASSQEAAGEEQQSGAQDEQQSGSSPSVSAPDSGAAAVGVDPANPPTPISTVTGPYAGQERITSVTADLLELRRSDKLLYGSFRITNKGDYTGTKYLHEITGALPFSPMLLDTTNLKQYMIVTHASSGANLKALANQPLYVHAVWAYPEGAKTMDIKVSDELPIMQGVPVP